MNALTALAISIGALGGLATFLFLGYGNGLQIWACFIGWASFFHCGGDMDGLKKSVTANVYGIAVAWVTFVVLTSIPLAETLGLPLWAGICVGSAIVVLVLASQIPALAAIPAIVYGYATTAGYVLMGNKLESLYVTTFDNPLINITISMIIGGLFGLISGKLAGKMTAATPQET